MENNMNQAINAIKLSSCISAQDGVISNRELDKCFELVTENFEDITKEIFDQAVDDFFDENLDLEDYLEKMDFDTLDKYNILYICYESAISDGFDIRENIAFSKACKFLKVSEEDFSNA